MRIFKMAEELVTTCPFCGQKFTGPGNSTRGYWEANGKTKEEDAKLGEKFRCCDDCNMNKVIPARLILMRQYDKYRKN